MSPLVIAIPKPLVPTDRLRPEMVNMSSDALCRSPAPIDPLLSRSTSIRLLVRAKLAEPLSRFMTLTLFRVPATWKDCGELPAPNGLSAPSPVQSSIAAAVTPLAPVKLLTSSASPETDAETTPPRLSAAAPPWRSIAVHLRRSVRSLAGPESSATVRLVAESDSPNDADSDSESSVKVVRRAFASAGVVTVTSLLVSEKWPEPLTTPAIESVSSVPSTWKDCGELPAPNGLSAPSPVQSSIAAAVGPLAPVKLLTSSASPETDAETTPPRLSAAAPPWRSIAVHLRRSVRSLAGAESSATVRLVAETDSPNDADSDSESSVKVVRRAFASAGVVTVTSLLVSEKWPLPETTPAIESESSVPSTWKDCGELPAPNGLSAPSQVQSSMAAAVTPLAPVKLLTSSASPETDAETTQPRLSAAAPPWRSIAVHLRRSVRSLAGPDSSATVSVLAESDSPNDADKDSESSVKVVRRAFASAGAVTVTSLLVSEKWPEPLTTPAIESESSVPSTWKSAGELPAPNGLSAPSPVQSSMAAAVTPLAPVKLLTSSASAETDAETTPPRLSEAAPPWRSIAVHLRRSVRSLAGPESSATVSVLAETDSPNDADKDSESSVKVVRRAFASAGAVTVTSLLVSEKWPEPLTTPAIESESSVPSTWKSAGELPAPNGLSAPSPVQSSMAAAVTPLAPVKLLTSSASAETDAETTPPRLSEAAPPWRSIAVHLRRSVRSLAGPESSATVSVLAETDSPNDADKDSESSVKVVRRAFASAGAVTVTSLLVSEKWPEPLTTPAIESVSSVPSTWKDCGELPAPNGLSAPSPVQSSIAAAVGPLAPVKLL